MQFSSVILKMCVTNCLGVTHCCVAWCFALLESKFWVINFCVIQVTISAKGTQLIGLPVEEL